MVSMRGASSFRLRLLLSALSGKPIIINSIRASDSTSEPGLAAHEVSFLRLIERLSAGSVVEISEDGTAVKYVPGVLVGGANLNHDCSAVKGSRAAGYFVEPLLLLMPFCKRPTSVSLRNVATCGGGVDVSMDHVRMAMLPLVRHALTAPVVGGDDPPDVRVEVSTRCPWPHARGEVTVSCSGVVKTTLPRSVDLADEGQVKRVRGIAWAVDVSPGLATRCATAAKGIFLNVLSDVYVFTDHTATKGAIHTRTPGFGIALCCETTAGGRVVFELDATTMSAGGDSGLATGGALPEEVGRAAASACIDQVARGGVVDHACQPMLLTLAALGPQELARARIGPITAPATRTLRLLDDILGVRFRLRPQVGTKTLFVSCVGAGVRNQGRKAT